MCFNRTQQLLVACYLLNHRWLKHIEQVGGISRISTRWFHIDKPRSSHRQSSQESSPRFLDGKNFFDTFSAGELSSSNAFMSPQWGGIMIYNLPRTTSTNNTKPQQMTVEMKPVMKVFLSQLKLLLGMMPVVRSSGTFNCFRVRIWECFQYDCERVIYPCGTAAERFVEPREVGSLTVLS